MDWPRLIVITLYCLGLLLPVWGAVRAWRRATRALRKQAIAAEEYSVAINDYDRQLASIRADKARSPDERKEVKRGALDEFMARTGQLGITPVGLNDLNVLGERAVVKSLQLVAHGNAGSALLIGVGLVCGTIASIAALYLPPPA